MTNRYFNNAGAGIMSNNTVKKIFDYIKLETEIGAYQAANSSKAIIDTFYEYSAKLLNANDKSEIAFVDSASRGWNLALYGISLFEGDTIVTLQSEYGTNLITIYDRAQKNKCNVKIIPCQSNGTFSLKDVEKELKNGAKVLAVSHVTAQGSIVNPIIELGELAKQYGVIYIVDGCQAVGQIPVDVKKIQCDAYITAGRKWLRGPRGTGILYVRKGAPISPTQLDLASADLVFDENKNVTGLSIVEGSKKFELWEKSYASMIGLTNAIAEYLNDKDAINLKIAEKANRIRSAVLKNEKFQIVGEDSSPCGIIGFYLKDPALEQATKEELDKNNVTYSLICDWDCPCFFPENGSHYIFRLSPHSFTEDMIIDEVIDILSKI